MAAEGNKNQESVKMVANAMRVLDNLKYSVQPQTAKEIAMCCNLNPATVQRILDTLQHTEWADCLTGERYIAGHKLRFITDKTNFYRALVDVTSQVLPHYVENYNVAMNVMIIEGSSCEIIQQVLTDAPINYVPPLNTKLPFYSCAGGKVLLSEASEQLINNLFQYSQIVPFTSKTICDEESFLEELREVRKNGYAIDYHEILDQGSCIAVPIRNAEGEIVASLSFSGITGMEDKNELIQYVPPLLDASENISHLLFRKTGEWNE